MDINSWEKPIWDADTAKRRLRVCLLHDPNHYIHAEGHCSLLRKYNDTGYVKVYAPAYRKSTETLEMITIFVSVDEYIRSYMMWHNKKPLLHKIRDVFGTVLLSPLYLIFLPIILLNWKDFKFNRDMQERGEYYDTVWSIGYIPEDVIYLD